MSNDGLLFDDLDLRKPPKASDSAATGEWQASAVENSSADCMDDGIQAAFEAFHEENPQVYQLLVGLAREGVQAGRNRLGIGNLFEVLRWKMNLRTTGDDFKLNNNFRSRYARMIMAQEPDLADVFETRKLESEGGE